MLLSFARCEPGAPEALAARAARAAAPARPPMSLHVVVAGGGTAGHVEPALALADAVRRLDPLGAGHRAGHRDRAGGAAGAGPRLPARADRRGCRCRAASTPRPAPRPRPAAHGAVRQTRAHLDRVGADVVVGFGGYVALPAYLAARRRRTAVVVHEANARAGLANRVGARLTPPSPPPSQGSGLRGAQVLGIPLRRPIAELDRAASRDRGPGALRPRGRTGAARHRRVPGGAARQRRGRRRRARAGRRQGCRCCTSPAQRPPRACRHRWATCARTPCWGTATGWTSRTPPPTWRCAGPER